MLRDERADEFVIGFIITQRTRGTWVVVGCGSSLIERRITNVFIDRGRQALWFPGWDHRRPLADLGIWRPNGMFPKGTVSLPTRQVQCVSGDSYLWCHREISHYNRVATPVLDLSDSSVMSHVGFKLQLKQIIKRVDYPIRHVSIKTSSYLDVLSAEDVLNRYYLRNSD